MMADLRNLANSQELYHNDNYTYSTSLTNLSAVMSDGVGMVVNEATNTGWAATSTHAALTTEQCGIYDGNATPSGGSPALVESVVTCTF